MKNMNAIAIILTLMIGSISYADSAINQNCYLSIITFGQGEGVGSDSEVIKPLKVMESVPIGESTVREEAWGFSIIDVNSPINEDVYIDARNYKNGLFIRSTNGKLIVRDDTKSYAVFCDL